MNPTVKEIAELLDFLPRIHANNFEPVKEWRGGKQPDGTFQIGYPEYHDLTSDFFGIASKKCWSAGSYNPVDVGEMIEDKEKIANANMSQIKEMLTFCVRGEHFCDGHWETMIKGGYINRVLTRLSQLRTNAKT